MIRHTLMQFSSHNSNDKIKIILMLLSYLMGVDILHLMKAEGGDSSLDSAWYKQVKNLPPKTGSGWRFFT